MTVRSGESFFSMTAILGYVAYGLDRHTHAHVPHFPHRYLVSAFKTDAAHSEGRGEAC